MSRTARVLFFIGVATFAATSAIAQPNILAVQSPPPNERGWTNAPAQVEFVCAQAVTCPDEQFVTQEGAEQILEVIAVGKEAQKVTQKVTLNLDWTAPLVVIQSPNGAVTTPSSSITVVARTTDAISQPLAATCNGRPTTIDDDGMIRCEVPLAIGANDVVVEVSDHADNSGSAGLRIVRTGAPLFAIVPEEIGMIRGQVTTVQVQDEAGRPARGVVWHVNNPAAGEISADGRHVFTAKAPGTVLLTATVGQFQATALVTIYVGDRLPPNAIRWKVGSLQVVQTPDTQPLKPSAKNLVATGQKPGEVAYIFSVNDTTGWMNWRERPASNPSETPASIREMAGGDAVHVYDSKETGLSALIHSGARPWRYQSAGRIRPAMMVALDNGITIMETTDTGFTRLVVFDGADGRVISRVPLPNGVYLALNARCIKGAHGINYQPAQIGPLNTDGGHGYNFGVVLSNDREDYGVCGQVSGTLKRTVAVVTLDDAKRIATAATLEVPAGSPAPEIDLFEVTIDRHGAKLLPWATRNAATGAREFRITRLTPDGNTKEYPMPGAGKVWLSGRQDDLAVTTDGTNLIGFNVVTGAVLVAQKYPAGVRILRVDQGQVLHTTEKTLSRSDLPIQR